MQQRLPSSPFRKVRKVGTSAGGWLVASVGVGRERPFPERARLSRKEPQVGGFAYELTRDSAMAPVSAHRRFRLPNSAKRALHGGALGALSLAVIAVWNHCSAQLAAEREQMAIDLEQQRREVTETAVQPLLEQVAMAEQEPQQAREEVEPLIDKMHAAQMAHDIIQMDETCVQVLKEKGRAPQSQSYMWVRRGGPPDRPVILFDYEPSRSGKVPAQLLKDFQGILQTDGYEGYAAVAKRNDIVSVGCLAHVRRKFDEALRAQKKKGRGGLAK